MTICAYCLYAHPIYDTAPMIYIYVCVCVCVLPCALGYQDLLFNSHYGHYGTIFVVWCSVSTLRSTSALCCLCTFYLTRYCTGAVRPYGRHLTATCVHHTTRHLGLLMDPFNKSRVRLVAINRPIGWCAPNG